MREESESHDLEVVDTDKQVPQEITRRIALNGTSGHTVTKDPVHGRIFGIRQSRGTFLVKEHSPQSNGANEGALNEGDHMHIPVYLCPLGKAVITFRQEYLRQCRGDDEIDSLVDEGCAEDMVDV